MAQGFYLKTSSGWKNVKKFFVKTSNGWKAVKFAYVKTVNYGWKLFYLNNSTYPINTTRPSITPGSYATTAITGLQALVETTLTGDKGTWTSTNGSITYSYLWFADGVSTGNTTTSFNTSSYDGSYITFQVTATNASGTTIATSDQIEVTKNEPAYIDYSLSTNTPRIGDTLSVTTHWQSASNTIPDYYTATFTSNSGTYTYNSQQTSLWYQYYVQSSDVGYPISVVVLAYNTGAPAGISTPTMTTNNVGYPVPVNTYAPYWTDTSNNTFSGQIDSGTTLRLHFGTWPNSPTYYEYEIYYNDQAGTIITQDISGTYTQNYVDYTFNYNASHTQTIGTIVYAGNSGGLSLPQASTDIGPVIPAAPGSFSIINFYDSSPTPVSVSVDTPYQGSGATANTLYYTWTAPTIYDYLGNAYTVGNFNSRYTGPSTSNSDTRTVTNDFWPNAITQSGYYYAYVAGVNTSVLQVTANWTASTNAAYYKVVYTINGTPYTSNALYTTSWSFISSSTVTFNGVIAYNSDASRTTIVSYNQDVTPTSKTGSEGLNYAYLTYTQPTWTVTYLDSVDSASGYVTVNQGSSITLRSPSGVANYTFNGWYTASSGGTRVGGGGNSYTPSSDIYLYAQWTYTPPTPVITQVYASGSSSSPFITFYAYGSNLGSISGTIYRSTTLNGTYTAASFSSSGTSVSTGSGGYTYYYYATIYPWTGASNTGTRGNPITTSKIRANAASFTQVY